VLGVAFHPAVPRDTCGFAGDRRFVFGDFGFDRKTEGGEAKASAEFQFAAAVVDGDVGGIGVIARPLVRVVDLRPDVDGAQAVLDDFVRHVVVGLAGQVVVRPKDFVHGVSITAG
jgi:hypothetical protein